MANRICRLSGTGLAKGISLPESDSQLAFCAPYTKDCHRCSLTFNAMGSGWEFWGTRSAAPLTQGEQLVVGERPNRRRRARRGDQLEPTPAVCPNQGLVKSPGSSPGTRLRNYSKPKPK